MSRNWTLVSSSSSLPLLVWDDSKFNPLATGQNCLRCFHRRNGARFIDSISRDKIPHSEIYTRISLNMTRACCYYVKWKRIYIHFRNVSLSLHFRESALDFGISPLSIKLLSQSWMTLPKREKWTINLTWWYFNFLTFCQINFAKITILTEINFSKIFRYK